MLDYEQPDIEQTEKRLSEAHDYLRIQSKRAELEQLDKQIAEPGFWDDANKAQEVSKQASVIRDVIQEYEQALALLEDARTANELAREDEEFAREAGLLLTKLNKLLNSFEVNSWFSGRFDAGDAILTDRKSVV